MKIHKKKSYLIKLAGNLNKYLLYKVLSGFVFFYVIDKIFMEARGLSVTEIVWVEIAYAATVIVLEVPSGALADRWSRKYVLAGHLLFFMGNAVLWALAHDFRMFVAGVMLGAVHSALRSGTDLSLFYDTLKELGIEEKFARIKGEIAFYYGLVAMMAGILGGMLAAVWGMEITFWLTLVPVIIALVIVLSMTEPQIHRTTDEVNFWQHMKEAAGYVTKHDKIWQLIMIGVFMGAAMTLVDEYMSLYFVRVGIPLLFIGYMVAFNDGLISISEKVSYKLIGLPRQILYFILIGLTVAGLIMAACQPGLVGIIGLFLSILAYYLMQPIFNQDVNRQISSSHRSTVMSYMGLLDKLIIIPIGLGFGYVADHYNLFLAYGLVGVIMGFYLLYYCLFARRAII